jgi:hypothetical protein
VAEKPSLFYKESDYISVGPKAGRWLKNLVYFTQGTGSESHLETTYSLPVSSPNSSETTEWSETELAEGFMKESCVIRACDLYQEVARVDGCGLR